MPVKRQTSNTPTCAFVAILQGPIEPSGVVPEPLQQHWGLFASQIKEPERDGHLMAAAAAAAPEVPLHLKKRKKAEVPV